MSTSELTDAPADKPSLTLEVSIAKPQACVREVVVTIPQDEVRRYLQTAFDELVPDAQVPGFRQGRAPRKLVEKQFKERVHEQVKSSLVMDSLAQVTSGDSFSAISEPSFDFDSVELPEDGDFKYQFTIEVRPEFETPKWQGLRLTRPVEETTDADIDAAIERLLSRNASLEATDEAAVAGDKLLITATFKENGRVLSEMDEERVTLTQRLSLSDAICENFGDLMNGAVEGETRKGVVKISDSVEDPDRRGKEIEAEFHVVEVLHKTLPELTPAYLKELGDFDSIDDFRVFVQDSLRRQASYREQQAVRAAVVQLLTDDATFELPHNLVRRQTARELERKILELRRSGFSEDQIRSYVNATRQNAQAATELALREHFILEQIAEELKVEAEAGDYDAEIQLIATQSDVPARRVRARLEKSGQMDALRNQIVERKVIETIISQAELTDQPVERKESTDDVEFAVYHNVLPTKNSDIPEALHDDSPDDDGKKDPSKSTKIG